MVLALFLGLLGLLIAEEYAVLKYGRLRRLFPVGVPLWTFRAASSSAGEIRLQGCDDFLFHELPGGRLGVARKHVLWGPKMPCAARGVLAERDGRAVLVLVLNYWATVAVMAGVGAALASGSAAILVLALMVPAFLLFYDVLSYRELMRERAASPWRA